MSLQGNLKQLRKAADLTQAQLAERAGVPQSLISEIETGKRSSTSFLPEIAKALGCSVDDLDKRYRSLVSSFDPDVPPEPEIGGEEEPSETPRPVDFPKDAIKELAIKAGMGTGQTITTTYVRDGKEIKQTDPILDDYWRLPPHFVRSALGARIADLLIIECQGDSMEPTLRAGDRVVVNAAHKRPSPDGLYAIRDQLGEIVVKRLEMIGKDPIRVRVISDNPLQGPKEWDLDEMEIVGKVVAGLKLF